VPVQFYAGGIARPALYQIPPGTSPESRPQRKTASGAKAEAVSKLGL